MKLRDELPRLEQLKQIARTAVWDGDLLGKPQTEALHVDGLIDRYSGYSFITREGLILLDKIGAIIR